MTDDAIILVPARMGSSRLPGKPLADIAGAPMIVHVLRRAREADAGPVLVAAAEEAIAEAVQAAGGEVVLTDPDLPSGSDRIAAALAVHDPQRRYGIVVNLQGDLPTIEPADIRRCVEALRDTGADIATLAAEIRDPEEAANPNVVKAIAPLDREPVALAQDFVRKLPENAEGPFFHHVGIYAYRRPALERFVSLPPSKRERERKLEQMRALDNGMTIAVARVEHAPFGVDAPEDLERVRAILGNGA